MLSSFVLSLVPAALTPVGGSVVISEFMAVNGSTLADQDGDFSDWIEIVNFSAVPVDLAGWSLTDDSQSLAKWTFPSVVLPSGGYLVVFASDKDLLGPQLHTNFKLTGNGEYLALVQPGGTVAFEYSPSFPVQQQDVSYGIDATLAETYFQSPTPGAPNGPGFDGIVDDTKFDVDRGFFQTPFFVGISTTSAGATIRYTTDGSAPSETSGTIYTGPVPITTTTVLRAMAYKPGWVSTDVDTQTYVYPAHVAQQPFSIPGYPIKVYSTGWQGQATMDYQMDPEVVGDPAYSGEIVPSLKAIPTISIAADKSHMFGAGGFYEGTDVIEPCSVEILYADDPAANLQAGAGVEAHSHNNLKRSLRLNFKSQYGDAKLQTDLLQRAPWNDGNTENEFDVLILRAGNNRGWTREWNPGKTTYAVDEFYRASQVEMHGVGSRGTYVHLYINGIYWGLYNIVERPDEKFASDYLGGSSADWFSVNHGGDLAGDDARYDYLTGPLIAKDLSGAANYAELQQFLDVESYCDYLILNWWTATDDWPQNNWYGGNRNASSPLGPTPFRYFAWDGEWSWDTPWPFGTPNPTWNAWVHPDFRKTSTGNGKSIAKIWHAARKNAEFMMLFADRVHHQLQNGGALSEEQSLSRFTEITDFLYEAVVAESARWGDSVVELGPSYPLRTRNVDWVQERNRMLSLIAVNDDIFIAALRSEGYYPSIDPPAFNQNGGVVYPGFQLTITNPEGAGTVYVTLDGSDPRLPGGGVAPSATAYTSPISFHGAQVAAKARTRFGSEWSALNSAEFTITPSPATTYGCINPSGSLELVAGSPAPGGELLFELHNPLGTQGSGSVAVVTMDVLPAAGFPCGVPIPGIGMGGPGAVGELLISLEAFQSYLAASPWTGTPVTVGVPVPNTPVIVGKNLYYQGALVDPVATFGVTVGVSQAQTVTFVAGS